MSHFPWQTIKKHMNFILYFGWSFGIYLAVARCFSCFTVVNKKKEKRAIKSKNDHYSTHDLSGSSRVLLANAQAAEKSVREE